jgi:hypothetical protein
MDTRKYICLMGLLFALLCPAPSSAEITFYVRPDGDKGFIIEGDDIKVTEGVEITVVYDTTILAHPLVSLLQAGNVTNIDDSNPGTLVFNANQGDNPGPSLEAKLSFDKKKDIQGGIFSVSGKIIGPDGTITPSRILPNDPVTQSSSLLSADVNYGETASSSEQSAAVEETATSGNRPDMFMKSMKSVLQRFKDFRGERGLRAFVALFERSPRDMLAQEPAIVLSDGKTPVRISLPLPLEEGDMPDIALSDAKLVHLENDCKKGWVITALPNEGTWNVHLLVKVDEKTIEFPLVVAPPVKIHDGITERNFVAELDRFIAGQAGGKGENDPLLYIPYEYIFTANYLAGSGNDSAKTTSVLANLTSNSK